MANSATLLDRSQQSRLMVEPELRTVEQGPEDIGKGCPRIGPGVDVTRHALRFLRTREAAEGAQVERFDLLGIRQRGIVHQGRELRVAGDAGGVGDELAVHHGQGLQDGRLRFRLLVLIGKHLHEFAARRLARSGRELSPQLRVSRLRLGRLQTSRGQSQVVEELFG